MINDNYKPTVFWAWNGRMSDEDIRRSVEAFSAAGIGGVHVHARAGLAIEYLGEDWMHAYKTAVEECKKHGIDVWIYDEQGWPSGFAGGKVCIGEEYYLKFLECASSREGIAPGRLLAAYRKDGSSAVRVPEDSPEANLFVYYEVQQHYVDLLNPAVTEKFIACTHEEYKKHFAAEFGKTIKGVFTDEPQIHVSSRAWSIAIPQRFAELYGEDVLDGLWLLFEDEGEHYQKFRYRYYNAVRDLFVHNYTEKISDWCEKNGLIMTGHFAGEEGLCVQVASNTGVMPHYEYMRQPGIDHLGRRLNAMPLMKQVESVATQFGKKRILSEVYACTGNGVSFRELAWIWDYHAVFGVNMPCISIAMQRLGGVRKRDYPAFFSPQQPWWPAFRSFAGYMKNSCEFVSQGTRSANVLVVSAVNSALEEPIASSAQKITSSRYRRLIEDLEYLQIPFDIGDEILLAKHGRAEEGKLVLGSGSYSMVILPRLDNIARSTIDLLAQYAANGGKILCMERLPARADGAEDGEQIARLKDIGIDFIQQRKGILEKYFDGNHYRREVEARDYLGRLADGVILSVRDTAEGKNILAFNPSTSAERHILLCAEGCGSFLLFDPVTGGTETLPASGFEDGKTCAKCTIPAQASLYVRFLHSGGCIAPAENYIEKRQERLPVLAGLGDNLMVVDYARYRFDGGELSARMPVVHILKQLYDESERRGGGRAEVEYTFTCSCAGARMALVAETEKVKAMRVNGTAVPAETKEYFADTDFRKYDVTALITNGENRVVLEFEIPALRLGFDLEKVHDSVRNKFSYPVEVESIYLLGDFSVQAKGRVQECINCVVTDGDFEIVPRCASCFPGDLTVQGNWFYTGNALYETRFTYSGGRVYLRAAEYAGAAVGIYVNGAYAGTSFYGGNTTDITAYLHRGENDIRLELLGTLRNMLGPHHHFKGEPEFTGVHTFTGEYGNGAIEDLSSREAPDSVWTDKYACIRFGLGKVEFIEKFILEEKA